jgi:hypothetical protein
MLLMCLPAAAAAFVSQLLLPGARILRLILIKYVIGLRWRLQLWPSIVVSAPRGNTATRDADCTTAPAAANGTQPATHSHLSAFPAVHTFLTTILDHLEAVLEVDVKSGQRAPRFDMFALQRMQFRCR